MTRGLDDFAPWLGVFETVRVVDGKPLFLAGHREELQRSMDALGLSSATDLAAAAVALPRKSGRWRWIVRRDATELLFAEERPPAEGVMSLSISPVRVGSANWDARFKTLSYLAHAQAWRGAGEGEVILLNEHGHVASASRSNIFWRHGARLYTPAHEAGCRCGVVRGFILAREKVEEGNFPLDEMLAADEIFLTNSMRGIVTVIRAEDKIVASLEAAMRLREAYDAEVARQRQATESR
jgi:4-amino-4-deoxychorismate lyase